MLDFIYKLNNKITKYNSKLRIIRKANSALFLISLKTVNLIMPLVYRLSASKNMPEHTRNMVDGRKVIVSLTSFPARIDYIWICIESLFRQSVRPDRIILWLAEEQFDGITSLPQKLLDRKEKGLEIKFCDDLRSHKKYYYTFLENPNEIIITVDDDVFYPRDTIKNLMELHKQYPNSICCNRGHIIKFNSQGKILPYEEWTKNYEIINSPSKLICPTGVGGVLYPPNSLDAEVFNKDNIINLCFFADDIWLKFMSLKNNTSVVKSSMFPSKLFTITQSQKESLAKINVNQGKNNQQINNLIGFYSESTFYNFFMGNSQDNGSC